MINLRPLIEQLADVQQDRQLTFRILKDIQTALGTNKLVPQEKIRQATYKGYSYLIHDLLMDIQHTEDEVLIAWDVERLLYQHFTEVDQKWWELGDDSLSLYDELGDNSG